jgi:hypothetical protein
MFCFFKLGTAEFGGLGGPGGPKDTSKRPQQNRRTFEMVSGAAAPETISKRHSTTLELVSRAAGAAPPPQKKNTHTQNTTIDILQSSHLVFPENISARTAAPRPRYPEAMKRTASMPTPEELETKKTMTMTKIALIFGTTDLGHLVVVVIPISRP